MLKTIQDFNPETVEEWLIHWKRWVRVYKQGQRCKSLESRYRSPQCWHAEPAKYPLDELLAQKIEDIWVHLPHRSKQLLKMHYVRGLDDWFILRRLRIRDIDAELNSVKYLIWLRFK